jgi:hypothetical protein
MLLDILPLTPADTARNRVWVGSWDCPSPTRRWPPNRATDNARLRDGFRPHLETARDLHGLVVQALFDPGRFPEDVQIAMVDDFVARLAGPGPIA